MTVSSTTTPIVQYSGNGVTVAFSTVFIFDASSDLRVIITDANGTDTVKTITTHYTVSGGSGAAGTVTMLTAPASGETLTIRRTTGRTQGVDYIENDSFPAESHEGALDKLTLITQELDEQFSRTITVSETSGLTDLVLTPVANELLVWDANGETIETIGLADIGATTFSDPGVLVYDGTLNLLGRTLTGTSNEITVTNGTGVSANPTIGLASALVFTGKTVAGGTFSSTVLTNPAINDANGNELLKFATTASAVNEVTVTNAATAGNPLVSATGGDTNIGLSLQAKGTGTVNILGTSSQEATLRLYEDTDNGSNYVGLKAPSSISSDLTFTLPSADGTSGQVLQTNGSGTLSWGTGTSAATQADQETGTSTTTYVSPGRQQYHPSAAKAWLYSEVSGGVPGMTASYNISSISDNGTGSFTVNINVDMSSADYCAVFGGVDRPGSTVVVALPATLAAGSAGIEITTTGGAGTDPDAWSVVFFGDQ